MSVTFIMEIYQCIYVLCFIVPLECTLCLESDPLYAHEITYNIVLVLFQASSITHHTLQLLPMLEHRYYTIRNLWLEHRSLPTGIILVVMKELAMLY